MRRAIVTLLALAVALAVPRAALADSARFDDPDDTNGALDIASVSHDNDDETATYRVDFHDPFRLEDVDGLAWEYDFDADGEPSEACALMRKIGTTGILRASFYRDCGPEVWATADARTSDRAIEFSLPLIDLVEGGGLRPGEPYSYRVVAKDSSGVEDVAPEERLAPHEDVPAPTARPGSAETELGFPGEQAADGAGNAARPAGAEDRLIPGEGEGPAPEGAGAPARVRLRFGPIPICAGASCFALGVGAPAAVFVLIKLVVPRVRARRKPSGDIAAERTQASRSHPGHPTFR